MCLVFAFPPCYSGSVKRKRTSTTEGALTEPVTPATLVPDAVVVQAGWLVEDEDRLPKTSKCVVCGEETPTKAAEGLCWVCRRLKFSAWRDSDTQMPVQE